MRRAVQVLNLNDDEVYGPTGAFSPLLSPYYAMDIELAHNFADCALHAAAQNDMYFKEISSLHNRFSDVVPNVCCAQIPAGGCFIPGRSSFLGKLIARKGRALLVSTVETTPFVLLRMISSRL